MPRGDQTGPNGMGPMTGRAAGYCTGNGMPGFANSMFGNRGGFGRGMGMGNRGGGWRRGGFFHPFSFRNPGFAWQEEGNEKQWLENQQNALKQTLEQIQQRLDNLESQKES